ncbi:MAG: Uma2 family endonuclease [Isosphaeraceae bacterium]
MAPDTLVAFGRPPGPRGSYMQWEEGGIAPQVVFEVLSPGNTSAEMRGKLEFYDRHGVEEYYIYDSDANTLEGWLRGEASLEPIATMDHWTSPRLGLRFERDPETLRLIRPDGRALETYEELDARADQAARRAERLAAQLRALGIEPEEPPPGGP